MRKGFVTIAAFAALFVAVFVGGLVLTFPSSILARVVEAQVEKALGFRYDITVESARLSGVGVRLRGVELEPTAPLAEGEVRLPTVIDQLTIRTTLGSLMARTPAARVDARIGDGRLVASYSPAEDGNELSANIYDIDLGRIDLIRQRIGVPLQGVMRGTIAFAYDAEGELSSGRIELNGLSLGIGPGMLNIPRAPLGLPSVTDLGTLLIVANIEGSSLSIERCESSGSDIRTNCSGTVDLRSPARASRVAMQLLVAPDSAWVEEAALGPVLHRIPTLQRAQTSEGYELALRGMLANLEVQPASGSSRTRERSSEREDQ